MSNLEILTKHIDVNNTDVAILSETWLKNKYFNIFTRNRKDGYGGVAILTKKFIKTKKLILNTNYFPMEVIEVEIELNKNKWNIVSVYIPPEYSNEILKLKLEIFFENYENKPNTLIGGDFNGHNPLWEEEHDADSRGNLLANIISEGDIQILNNGTHTYFNSQNHKSSAVDLAFIYSSFKNIVLWRCDKINVGSDHYPITIEINVTAVINENIKK